MKRYLYILVFGALLMLSGCLGKNSETLSSEGTRGKVIPYKSFSLEDLQEDYRHFRNCIEIQHPQLFTDKEKLKEVLDFQETLLKEDMDIFEFYQVLVPVLGALGDSHSLIFMPQDANDFAAKQACYLPLVVRVVENSIFVIASLEEEVIPSGSEILSINGVQSDEIIKDFRQYLPSDGYRPESQNYLMNFYFNEFYYSMMGSPSEFKIEFYSPDGTSLVKQRVKGALLEDVYHERGMAAADFLVLDPSPLVTEINSSYGYLRIKGTFSDQFALYSDEFYEYQKTLDDFFLTLHSQRTENLILDLRTGYGSTPVMASYLFRSLMDSPHPYFKGDVPSFLSQLRNPQEPTDYHYDGNIYALIDGSTLSIWGQFAALLKYYDRAIFIGEESGGAAMSALDVRFFPLPHTGITFQYPADAWSAAVDGMPLEQGIQPDHKVLPSIKDLFENEDTLREYAVKLIQQNI